MWYSAWNISQFSLSVAISFLLPPFRNDLYLNWSSSHWLEQYRKKISRYDCLWLLNQAIRLDRWGSVTTFIESEYIPLMFFLDIRDELPKSPYMAAKGRVVLGKGNNQHVLGMCEYQNGAGFCNPYGSVITQKFRNSSPAPIFMEVILSRHHMCTSLIPIWKLRIEIPWDPWKMCAFHCTVLSETHS